MEKNKRQKHRAFTMVEILIAVTIVAVLAMIALPRFFKQKEKVIAGEAVAMLSAIRYGELSYRTRYGNWARISSNTDLAWSLIELDAPTTGDKVGFEYTVDENTGIANATRATRLGGGQTAGQSITLRLDDGTWGGNHTFAPKNIQ